LLILLAPAGKSRRAHPDLTRYHAIRQRFAPVSRPAGADFFAAKCRIAMASIASTTPTATIEFETLAEHRAYLMKIARLELRDEHLAEDCVSDVLT